MKFNYLFNLTADFKMRFTEKMILLEKEEKQK